MGHNRLGRLPRTYHWKKVIELLEGAGSVSEIADASLAAARAGLQRVPQDPGFALVLTAIFKFIESTRADDFDAALQQYGFSLRHSASLFDVVCCLKDKIDSDLSTRGIESDVSEIAQNSFTETLFKYVTADAPSLFEATAETLQQSLRRQLTGNRFKLLMHEYFSAFTRRYLTYYLSREVPNHVGPEARFQNIDEHEEFSRAFDLYVRQAVRIADEFTPGWFGKAEYEGRLTYESISRYAHVAFKKIVEEFR
jgi:hypothetical protein